MDTACCPPTTSDIYDDITACHHVETRKVGPSDLLRRSGPGLFYLFFGLYTYIYIIVRYNLNDMTARHDREDGLTEFSKMGLSDMTRRSGSGMFAYHLYIYSNIYFYIIAIYDDSTARHDGGATKWARTTHRSTFGPMYVLFLLYTTMG